LILHSRHTYPAFVCVTLHVHASTRTPHTGTPSRYGGWDSEAYAFANIGRRYGLCERASQRALQLVRERGAEWRARTVGDGLADEGAIMVQRGQGGEACGEGVGRWLLASFHGVAT
jgi:hypothetical protein